MPHLCFKNEEELINSSIKEFKVTYMFLIDLRGWSVVKPDSLLLSINAMFSSSSRPQGMDEVKNPG